MKTVILEVAYQIGDTVYHKLDREVAGLVVGYNFTAEETVIYDVVWADGVGSANRHYSMELTDEKSFDGTPDAAHAHP